MSPDFLSVYMHVPIYTHTHVYLLAEWNVLPLLFAEVPWFTPDAERIHPSQWHHSTGYLHRTSFTPSEAHQHHSMIQRCFLASLSTRPMKAELSKGSQRLLAQGLCFYKSLWFTSIHQVSCSNVSGSWLIPLNIKRTSPADMTNRAWIQLYFLKPLLCPVLLSCSLSVKQAHGRGSTSNPCHCFLTITSTFLSALQFASLQNKLPSWLSGDLRLSKQKLFKFELVSMKEMNMKYKPYKQVMSCLD